jgi:hypothetical protein
MSNLWIAHHSIGSWLEASLWTTYFKEAQRLLGSPLTHLDINDPVKRKIASLEEAGDFVCAFEADENRRWLFGRCGGTGIRLSVQLFRQLSWYPNTLKWHVPLTYVDRDENRQRLKALFNLGNKTFKPFYAYSDDVAHIAAKKKSSGAVDIQAELLGVFWLTYFNAAYVGYFGREKFKSIPVVDHADDGGITIVLADSPKSVGSELREQSAAILGRQSFVNPNDIMGKQQGRFAMTFQQMLDAKG